MATPARAYRLADHSPPIAGESFVGWADGNIAYQLGAPPPGVGSAEFAVETAAAFAIWSAVSCADLSVLADGSATSTDADDGLSSISAVLDDWDALGYPVDAVGHAEVRYTRGADGTWSITEADVFLNAVEYSFSTAGRPGTVDVRTVVLHELGHALGIAHPCEGDADCLASSVPEVSSQVMYPTVGDEVRRELGGDDVAALCALYPRAVDPCGACSSGETCVAGVCVAPQPASCVSPVDCDGAPCTDGYCEVACTNECAGPYACESGICRPRRGAFGDACEYGDECTSTYCLDEPGGAPFCTGSCSSGSECPSGFTCSDVDGLSLCRTAAGCAASPPAGGASPLLLLFLLAVLRVGRRSLR